MSEVAIRVSNLTNRFGRQVVHKNLDLDIYEREILGIIGGSGSGKSVLLRTILGLNIPYKGEVEIFSQSHCDYGDAKKCFQRNSGVMYQDGALFTALTVLENVMFPMREHTDMPEKLMEELAMVKLGLVGLSSMAASKHPSELSGGMRKRVALARALALDPHLLFLDEPTAGLDPLAAEQFDELIVELRDYLDLTVVLITHDLDTLFSICNRIAALVDKKIVVGTPNELRDHTHPWIQSYFHGQRAEIAWEGQVVEQAKTFEKEYLTDGT